MGASDSQFSYPFGMGGKPELPQHKPLIQIGYYMPGDTYLLAHFYGHSCNHNLP